MIIKKATRLASVKEYYFSKKLQEIREMIASGKEIINLGIGNPDLPPSSNSIDALIESAKTAENHGYQSYKGIDELRTAIAAWYQEKYHVLCNPKTDILPLLGSKEGIFHITMAFINEGDEVLIPNPGYPTYASVSRLAGAKVREYNLTESNSWQIDLNEIRNMDLSKVKIMWVNFPHMPTGTNGSENLFEELIKIANKNNFLIVNDNPYSMILNDKPTSFMQTKGAFDVALELNSMSKSHHMAGWRLGWIIGNEAYINTVLTFKSNIDSGMFLPIQHAAIEAFNNSSEWHNTQNKQYGARRTLARQIMDSIQCTYSASQNGLYIWAKIPYSEKNSEEFADKILNEHHVFITPGFIFGSNGERFVRLSLSNNEETLKKALHCITSKKQSKSRNN